MRPCDLCVALDEFYRTAKSKGWAVNVQGRACAECGGSGFLVDDSPRPKADETDCQKCGDRVKRDPVLFRVEHTCAK